MQFNTPQEVLNALAHAYYEDKNSEAVLSCVTEDVEWIGTERQETAKGKAELAALLGAHFAAVPQALYVSMAEPEVQKIGADVAVLTLAGKKNATPGAVVAFLIRGTVSCVKTERGWLIFNLHISAPNAEVEKASLQSALEEERAKQKDLLDNVPGGIAIYRAKKDGRFTADYFSDNLARICGYANGEEALRAVGNDVRAQLLPEDYPVVAQAYKASMEKGVPTKLQYRVHGKDGNSVRITMDAVIMKNTPLGEDDIAVFYAVHTLVSEEENQKEEEQQELLSLLNTVPAGIGIVDIDANGITQSYLNDAFYEQIGVKREDRTEYFGDKALRSTHPDDMPVMEEGMQRLLAGDNAAQLDYRVKGGQGKWYWLHLSAIVVERYKDSAKLHVSYIECTESKHKELQLLQNQRAVALAEYQGNLSIWTYNIDKGIIIQQIMPNSVGHMGYPYKVTNVPAFFLESGSIHPEDEKKFMKAYRRLMDGAEKVDEIYRLKNQATGTFDWVHMYYQRMEANEEGDRMAIGCSLTVNEQQEAVERYLTEQKLREQMYASAILYMEYNLTHSVYVGKNNLQEQYRHGRWECPTAEEYRENMSQIVEAAYLDKVTETLYAGNLLKAFEQGKTKVSCDYRSKERPSKPSLWCRITAIMVRRPDTGDVMAFVYVEDIEEDKDRQLAVASSMADGIEGVALIQLADGHTRFTIENGTRLQKEAEKHLVYDDDFVKRSSMATVPEEREFSYQAALLSTVKKELEKREIYQYAITTHWHGGNRKRILFRFRYLDDRKTNIIMSISDVTDLYREEQRQKQQLTTALSEAKVASQAKTDFLSRVSHDMRTPLNGILGLTTLLKDSVTDPNVIRDLGELEMSGKYLLNLINDTLDMSRIETGNLELHPIVCDGRKVFNNAIGMGKLSLQGRNIAFNVHAQNTPFTLLYVDVSRVEQIFMNVFGNAVKFTPDGGTIDFTMTNLSVEDGVITNKLVISDTGIGMSPEFLPHIFEAFSQADTSKTSASKGTGLGMAITKQLVELMGGSISVESELGKGTTFTIILKLRIATDEQIAAWEKTLRVSSGVGKIEGKRVLLVEDHPLNAKIAIRLLEAKGAKVDHAENGKIGVDMFSQSAINYYDAILMDIRMPVMDGIEATKTIRHLSREDAQTVPIIAMTANAFADDMEQTQAAGMDAHLSKPIQADLLFDTLAEKMRVPLRLQRQRILVVDDVEVNRAVIRATLEKDYQILEAENGKQAMDILRETGGVDAVITDIQMPEMGGIELIRTIRSDKKYRHMVIIANTQYGDPKQEEMLLSMGANDFVYKPTTPSIVEIRVRNALRRI